MSSNPEEIVLTYQGTGEGVNPVPTRDVPRWEWEQLPPSARRDALAAKTADGKALYEAVANTTVETPEPLRAPEPDYPTWYRNRLDKALMSGETIPAWIEGETQKGYDERVAALERSELGVTPESEG